MNVKKEAHAFVAWAIREMPLSRWTRSSRDLAEVVVEIRKIMEAHERVGDAVDGEGLNTHDAGKAPMGLCDCSDNVCIVRRQKRRQDEGLCPVCGATKDKDFGQFCKKHGAGAVIMTFDSNKGAA